MMRRPKVIHKRNLKAGKLRVWGTAKYSTNPIIELDSALKGFDHLTILCHEAVHLAFPNLGERKVREAAKLMAATIWSQRYRRVET
jgi:hypothetical protein